MNWLNMPTEIARAPEFVGSEPTQRAAWLSLLLYSTEQENGGLVPNARSWKDRQWQQSCGVTLAEVEASAPLLTWEGTSLRVFAYPIQSEAKVRAQRGGGRIGGLRSGQTRREGKLETKPEANPEGSLERNGNGNGNGNENENGNELALGTAGAVPAAKVLKPRKSIERNPVIDALAGIDGSQPAQVTPGAWSGIGKALAEIKAVCPSVDAAEIMRRAENYKAHMPQVTISPLALAKHWAKCEAPPAAASITNRFQQPAATAADHAKGF